MKKLAWNVADKMFFDTHMVSVYMCLCVKHTSHNEKMCQKILNTEGILLFKKNYSFDNW